MLAEAGHNLSDVAGLLLAWAALGASRLRGNNRHTYGWRRGSILASFANAVVLLMAMGSLGWEALGRLQAPAPVEGVTMMLVAGVGVIVNTLTARLFIHGSKKDLNMRGAFLHMAADALVSVGVVRPGLRDHARNVADRGCRLRVGLQRRGQDLIRGSRSREHEHRVSRQANRPPFAQALDQPQCAVSRLPVQTSSRDLPKACPCLSSSPPD